MARQVGHPSDVTDAEWAFVAPYLALVREDAPQRQHSLRAVFNALRYLVKTGCGWRYLPQDLPPWQVVYQQWARWRDNRCFEHMMADLRELARVLAGRQAEPTAVILDSRTVQSTPESGARAGYDGAKRRKGSKVHVAVDTLGHLLAAVVTPANAPDAGRSPRFASRCSRSRGNRCRSPTPTRATRAKKQNRRRRCPILTYKSLPSLQAKPASCCCPAAGWWSAASAGPPASAAWPATTNGWP